MPQLPLFPVAGPMVGRTDPETSHAAAAVLRGDFEAFVASLHLRQTADVEANAPLE